MPELVVRGGEVVDAGGRRRADVLVADGVVRAVAEGLDVPAGAIVLDAGGCVVAPGLVDLHAHLRQPGKEEAETVEVVAEPFLVRAGLMARTPRGRVATPKAWEHLGLVRPDSVADRDGPGTVPLFD